MNAHVFISGFLLFLACLCIHILVWHIKYPQNRAWALTLLFFILPAIAAVLYAALTFFGLLPHILPFTLSGAAAVFLLHYSLSSAYIMTYPALEAISPSLVLVLLIGRSREGFSKKDLSGFFDNAIILSPRIADLHEMNLISEREGSLYLNRKGRLLIYFFVIYRSFLGLPAGRG